MEYAGGENDEDMFITILRTMMMVVVEYAGGENDEDMFKKQTNKQS